MPFKGCQVMVRHLLIFEFKIVGICSKLGHTNNSYKINNIDDYF